LEGGREEQHATTADDFGKRKGHLFSPPCIYTSHEMRWGV